MPDQRRPIVVEIGEFMANPVRSGIQRVVRELISNWPDDVPVRYTRYDPTRGGLARISTRSLRLAVDFDFTRFCSPYHASQYIQNELTPGTDPLCPLQPNDRVLVPELFYGVPRVTFYRNVLRRNDFQVYFIVYDFIPWFKPEEVSVGSFSAAALMPYLMMIREARHRCFISGTVKLDFERRIARDEASFSGPVIALGADSIKIEYQSYTPDRDEIVCIGTLDGKKRQEVAFQAFLSLPAEARGRFVCLGKVPARPAPWMKQLLNHSSQDVEIVDSPSEEVLASRLRRAKATVFISTNEGFGLPAVESLNCGIPVVAHAGLPSLADLPEDGQIRLQAVNTASVAEALTRLLSGDETERLWAGVSRLRLPTWKDYAESLAAWLTQDGRQ